MDLGAGDGRFVLAHARQHPDRFVLGIDASRDVMREASWRASRKSALPNALFVVSAVEALPAALAGGFDLVTVHFPWGSLGDAATGHDRAGAERLASLVRHGGELRLLLSHAARDGVAPVDPSTVAAVFEPHGLAANELRPATLADAEAAHSSWGKRLLRHPDPGRTAWLIGLKRPAVASRVRG